MDDKQARALEAAAVLYTAIPGYLFQNESPRTISTLIIQLADALDDIEYERSGVPLLDILTGSTPGRRKRAILHLQHTHNLTEREGHILRYLANDRNPTYIAKQLNIAQSTAKAHKYSIFKKLGIHTTEELKELLKQTVIEIKDAPDDLAEE